ncbi:MAG TPA: AAA family ATPase [Sphingomonas sp.]|uniref:chromosome segregation SMC family protein n=1 Tax=Sphingomonas sp. TaxID=28214 RepID=UPI002C067D0F|nr:AAA family ATPase [Sphingomonas sp.]HMI20696.1 AAA family ATPase [Sphingomonas sp.]
MRIRKLRLTGFKSFVEPAELLIEPGLTGVVGPNGCGKSNLLEAIRWVMGEGSPKSLRSGGMEDVIFAGTASRPSRDFAEVSLLTEGAEGENEVVRRIERGAGSAYRINGRDVRQRDVALLFADAATGAHSPALVSQGRIASVIAAKPTERRQMLEEAAGIAGLHVRRREAELKLRATETNLQRLDELLGEMEARMGALRRQAKAAERYRILSTEIRLAEARSLFARWREAAAAAEAARHEATTAEQAVAQAGEAQRAAAAHSVQATARLAEARVAAEAAREAAGTVRHRLEGLRAEKASIERRLGDLAMQAEALVQDRAREDTLAIDAAAALERLTDEEQQLARSLAAGEAQRAALDGAVVDAERAARDADVASAQALARAAAEQADARVAETTLAGARQRRARADTEIMRLNQELAALGEAAPMAAALEAARKAHGEAEARLATLTDALSAAEAKRDAAAGARDTAESAMASARAALAGLESEERALASALAQAKGDRALSALKVTPGYERALAAALGEDLDAPIGSDGVRGWAGAASAKDDPALPAGVAPLGPQVQGGDALARRLAQVGVVDRDEGQPLAVGQRIVTRDGQMRRWDGYYARDVGAAAAERLIRANRHAELTAQLPAARAAVDAAKQAFDAAAAAQQEARAAIDKARADIGSAEQALRTARRDEDNAAAAIERRGAAAAALDQRRASADAEQKEALAAEQAAETARAALPDGAETRGEVERLGAVAEAARAKLAEARGRALALAQSVEHDGRRLQAAKAEAKGWKSRAGDAARRIAEMTKREEAVAAERATLIHRPAELDAALESLGKDAETAEANARAARETESEREAELRRIEQAVAAVGETLAAAREARAGAQARAEHQESRRAELSHLSGERFDCPAATLADRIGFDSASLAPAADESARHDRLVADRERLGPVNLVAESELAEIEGARETNAAERDELYQAVNRLRGSIGSLNREGRQRLLAAFEAVDMHFRRLFATLFAGGEAHLALIDSDDPLEAGLEIMAQPPGKKLGSLTLLSGGEQALTAVALIFALFLTNPAPICVLDEVDAPLDDANIERFCDLLLKMTEETETRYLVVTHNAVTMSRMHRLFGVTMIERGVSRLVSVDLGGAETLLAAE